MSAPVAFVLNGEAREAPAGTLLLELLRELGIDAGRIALERNREVVPRAEHPGVVIEDGDEFEIVQFVGGG
jgi:thiamine biosynthesis protein ThiS